MEQISKQEALIAFRTLGRLLEEVYGLTQDEMLSEAGISVPSGIFKSGLPPLSALATFLSSNNMTDKEIAKRLSRNRNFIRESITDIGLEETGIKMPLNVFNDKLSILESAAHYLKSRGLSNAQISKELGKSQTAVWILLKRVDEKLGEKK